MYDAVPMPAIPPTSRRTQLAAGPWVAFGPEARNCAVSFAFFAGLAPDALCRSAFGAGALLLALVLRRLAQPVRPIGEHAH